MHVTPQNEAWSVLSAKMTTLSCDLEIQVKVKVMKVKKALKLNIMVTYHTNGMYVGGTLSYDLVTLTQTL